jgi:hypothetical protein
LIIGARGIFNAHATLACPVITVRRDREIHDVDGGQFEVVLREPAAGGFPLALES